MMKRFLRQKKTTPILLALTLAAVAIAVGTSAFTATNTVASGGVAGQGSASISGYTVTNPSYTLLGSDPTKISAFSFTMSTVTASTVTKASIVPGTWIACTQGAITAGSATETCTFAGGSEAPVASATLLNVSATG